MDENKGDLLAGIFAAEKELKQRQFEKILNMLTPHNAKEVSVQVKEVKFNDAATFDGLVSQIFDKALMEPTICEMYASLCSHLVAESPDLGRDNEKINVRRILVNKCQEECERVEREKETSKADESEAKQCDEEEIEEKSTKARRRLVGTFRFIGELYKKKILTERIVHECIKKLLNEENIEALCELMSTVGEKIDHPKAKEHMDVYFERMRSLSNNMNLSSRVRFLLKDVIDFRKNKWQQRRKIEGPKKIEEVHRNASQDRQSQAGRQGRGFGNIEARKTPINIGPRGSSMFSSPNAQKCGLRGFHTKGPIYTDAIACEVSVKKYSRDFLLKLAMQCTELPEGFQVAADIGEALMSFNAFQSLLHKAENKHELGKVGDEKEANQRQSKAVSDDRLDELFSRLDDFQCYVRERLDHIDSSIASLDFQVRRLQYIQSSQCQPSRV